jgi:hypothetical protein
MKYAVFKLHDEYPSILVLTLMFQQEDTELEEES